MILALQNLKKIGLFLAVSSAFIACKKDDDQKSALRARVEYSLLKDTTTYSKTNGLFLDAGGKSTVDVTEGTLRYKMFAGINTYLGLGRTSVIDSVVLKNLYSNVSNPFITAYHADFAVLNASGLQLRNVTASSWTTADAETVRKKITSDFKTMAQISASNSLLATDGTAGYLLNGSSKYMVDAKGIETAQVIQKALIGAFQLDYIGNVLLNSGLGADNYSVVSGKNYTELEHNWDVAYGTLTLNPNYLKGSTSTAKGTTESFLGSYVWEYNQDNYAKTLPAFLKGRVAVINNDKTELKAQADFIRTQLELAIAKAALGYLTKSIDAGNSVGARAHAFGEGLGFIYSLRFASKHGAGAQFSDEIVNDLTAGNGFWGLTAIKTNAAATKIKAKFNIQ